ncbi:NADH dehydrogenase [ubiquinone] 1 alpha subcomplex assembly factor 7 [Paragonimus westermani]|uniref:Protein arginine methyltransferase NDUFAF7 n=1 Tax=Paragonimus westermani TaxID=34504 RepID=A0A5J4NEF2_9TREM|nr:NADH dehydrogenase [ubiquinone] 1 alpha subcomplex assembly factor 7 [Paragonimus westermani]
MQIQLPTPSRKRCHWLDSLCRLSFMPDVETGGIFLLVTGTQLVGVWLVNIWADFKCPTEVNLVELGPGRGTLASDILRVFSRFPTAYNAVSLHLVEVSPKMRSLQKETIFTTVSGLDIAPPPVHWYTDFRDVPDNRPTFVLAHEFLDALPVHQFRKNKDDWREVLVDVAQTTEGSPQKERQLCFVQAPSQTSTQLVYLPLAGDVTGRDFVEVCPRALVLIDDLCQRLTKTPSAALLIDYGHLGEKGNTLRGFRNHQVCDALLDPGNIDLTCDVDFSMLQRRITSSGCNVNVYGPVTQAYFLINMGLLTRLKMLVEQCDSESQREELLSGCEMLITEEQMGERFKFLAIVSPRDEDGGQPRPLPGFTDLPGTPYADSTV